MRDVIQDVSQQITCRFGITLAQITQLLIDLPAQQLDGIAFSNGWLCQGFGKYAAQPPESLLRSQFLRLLDVIQRFTHCFQTLGTGCLEPLQQGRLKSGALFGNQ